MAYPPTMAAALSGATISQLRHWRNAKTKTGPLLVPEISASPRVFYSFRDLLALRTFVHLRQVASLQKIRVAISNLASYELVSDRRGNIQLLKSDEAAIDLVHQPGQTQLLVVMGEVIEPFPVRPGVVVPHLFRPREHLSVDPDTQGGIPVISGTRVPYDAVASIMREDVPAEKVSDYYPTVTAQAARDALDFAMYVDSYGRAA
jgi:uncharacterized protein (DUF433 family)/DNA-binding transcriptional MerR regulator